MRRKAHGLGFLAADPAAGKEGQIFGASGWRGCCARRDFTASVGAGWLPPQCGITPPNPLQIWSNATSPPRCPIVGTQLSTISHPSITNERTLHNPAHGAATNRS